MKKQTYSAKTEDIQKKWYVVDAEGKVLGRLASEVAKIIRGKHNPLFTPHVDCGDFVIVVNAEKVVLTGRKLTQKKYYRHSGYTGALKETTAEKLLEKKPEQLVTLAVKGMLSKSRLGSQLNKNLKVYSGSVHPHNAQQPEVLEF